MIAADTCSFSPTLSSSLLSFQSLLLPRGRRLSLVCVAVKGLFLLCLKKAERPRSPLLFLHRPQRSSRSLAPISEGSCSVPAFSPPAGGSSGGLLFVLFLQQIFIRRPLSDIVFFRTSSCWLSSSWSCPHHVFFPAAGLFPHIFLLWWALACS